MSNQIEIYFNGKHYIDRQSHLTVFGFIRNSQTLHSSEMIIPQSIYILCLMFYHEAKLWDHDKHSSCIKISGDQAQTITVDCWGELYQYEYCSYGYHWINSMSNKLIRYKLQVNTHSECRIGISSKDTFFESTFCTETIFFMPWMKMGIKYQM